MHPSRQKLAMVMMRCFPVPIASATANGSPSSRTARKSGRATPCMPPRISIFLPCPPTPARRPPAEMPAAGRHPALHRQSNITLQQPTKMPVSGVMLNRRPPMASRRARRFAQICSRILRIFVPGPLGQAKERRGKARGGRLAAPPACPGLARDRTTVHAVPLTAAVLGFASCSGLGTD